MRAWAVTARRLLLAGVWIAAGGLKMADPAAALRAVRAYRLLPEDPVPPVAFGLPVVEVALGLALLLGAAVRLAPVASAVLLAVFVVALASTWARGLQIDCGCFGGGGVDAAGRASDAGAGARPGPARPGRHAGPLADQPPRRRQPPVSDPRTVPRRSLHSAARSSGMAHLASAGRRAHPRRRGDRGEDPGR